MKAIETSTLSRAPAHYSVAAETQSSAMAAGLTVREVALRFRVSPDKVRAWIARGELRAINTAAALCGKPRWVVLVEALAAFERGRAASSPPKPVPRRRRSAARDYYPD